jgi:hypothetical protein
VNVPAAMRILKADPEMVPAAHVISHLSRNYVGLDARFPHKYWSQYENTLRMRARTTNGCESYHSKLNQPIQKNQQIFRTIYQLELIIIAVERTHQRFLHGDGYRDLGSKNRAMKSIREQRTLRRFLLMEMTLTERMAKMHNKYEVIRFVDEYLDFTVPTVAESTKKNQVVSEPNVSNKDKAMETE